MASTKFVNREVGFALVKSKLDTGLVDEPLALAKDLDYVEQETLLGVLEAEVVLYKCDREATPWTGRDVVWDSRVAAVLGYSLAVFACPGACEGSQSQPVEDGWAEIEEEGHVVLGVAFDFLQEGQVDGPGERLSPFLWLLPLLAKADLVAEKGGGKFRLA